MPDPAPVDYLQPDEAIRQEAGRHPASLLDEWLGAIVFAAIAVGAIVFAATWRPEWAVPWAWLAIGAVLVVLSVFMVVRYWRMRTSHYVVTDERVYKAYGRIRFFLLQTTYDKVTDLHVRQSLWGRLGDFGTIRVETAGTGVVLEGVRAPLRFKQVIETSREAFIRKLLGEHVPETTTEARPPDDLLWRGGPVAVSMLGGFVSAGSMALYAALASAGALVFDRLGAWVPLAAWALAVVIAARTWIRFRYTRYEVRARGVVITAGWLSRRRVETRYEKVTDVTTYQGLLGRLLGFGAITINTAGSNQAPVVFSGVADPEGVKHIIDGARGA